MTALQDILTMAANQEKAARMAVEAGERFGYDASREALEYADIARILRLAAKEMEHMAPDAQHIPADPAEQPIERVKGRVKTVLRVHLVMQFNRISDPSCAAADEIVSAIGADMDAVRIGYDASEFWIDEVEAVEAETFDGDEDEAIEQEAQS